jgi:group II intron reverse transcriptase/maturase
MDVGGMQRKLSRWAEEDTTRKITDLYSLLCNETWLREAHQHVNTNAGRRTAGINGVTMAKFNENLDTNLDKLREQLKAEVFEPQPVRRAYIPKANGKRRPLGIPSIADRIVQEALRMILEPIWESDFSTHSYGFRPNRSTYDAISYIGNRLTNTGWTYQWVIEGDITSYFDSIPHRKLMKAVKKRIADRKIRGLLWKFLRAGVLEQGEIQDTLTGTPQGGIISPLLANIYLHTLDKYMESRYLTLSSWHRMQRRKQGKSNFLYVRYADDFVVLCNGSKANAQAMKEELGELLSKMGLKLSEEKTKITHITEGFDFLGYRIIRSMGQKGKMVPKVLIPPKAITRVRQEIRRILAPDTAKDSVRTKILAVNSVSRGWCQYYRCTSKPSKTFNALGAEIFWEMAHWLGRKYKVNMPRVMQRFRQQNTLGTNAIQLFMPTLYKSKKLLIQTWKNPYTGTSAIHREAFFSYSRWPGLEERQGMADLREELLLTRGTDCDICSKKCHPFEIQVDHITPRAAFKDPTEADRMDNLQKLCSPCHRAKTKIDRKVLSRMR